MSQRLPSSSTRRRGQALEGPILEAAWQELSEAGWAGFRMERVAARAGAGKASLYKRWPDRLSLVREAFVHKASTSLDDTQHTGDVREDLATALAEVADLVAGPGGEAIRGLLSTGSDESGRIGPGLFDPPIPRLRGVADQAGNTPADPLVLHMGIALIIYQFLVTGRPPDRQQIERIVDDTMMPLLNR